MTYELDQIVNVYRFKLKKVESLWLRLMRHCQFDPVLIRSTQETADHLERGSFHFMEQQLTVEKAKQKLRSLKQVLDVTRQIVEAKSRHMRTAEQQLEQEQHHRLKEFNKIHKLEGERVEIEKGVQRVKERVDVMMEKLNMKCNMKRYLEDFTDCIIEQLGKDLTDVNTHAVQARQARSNWDRFDVDVHEQIKEISFDGEGMKSIHGVVQQMTESLENQTKWYEEELQTKLFYSSQNKEIQNRIACLKTVIKRMERSGRSSEDHEENTPGAKPVHVDDFIIKTMVDGIADIQVKDVEEYLSQQFGIRVMADYSMLRRLKEEIGVIGLAYLVERIRFQETFSNGNKSRRTFKDMEESKIETALKTIAMEYKQQDESPWLSCEHKSQMHTQESDRQDNEVINHESPAKGSVISSPSGISSLTSASVTADAIGGRRGHAANQEDSTSSLKSKSSMSRIKKIFNF